jgi:hypothetical protein
VAWPLILRVIGTPVGDHWTTYAWYLFAGVAGPALLSKYVIRYHGSHVFNPSNIGLVVAFIVLGTSRVEPLDFWWAPLNLAMIAAYAVILGGGLLITRRLRLLALAGTFWIALTIGLSVLAGSGHCMTARWAFAPVCGWDFVRVIAGSPEVMIFLFFMMTDPKTVPAGRVGRVAFGLLVALASTLLMAPQVDEFGTKVGLLAGLAVVCAARPLLDRLMPEPRSAADDVGAFAVRLVGAGQAGAGILGRGLRVAALAIVVIVIGAGIVLAGAPARVASAADPAEVLNRLPADVDPATFPSISVGTDVTDWDHEIAGAGAQAIILTLAQNLELENQALLHADPSILPAVDHGDRLIEMQGRLQTAISSGTVTIARYRIEAATVSLLVPFGRQTGLSLGFDSRGTVTELTYSASGVLEGQQSAPFAMTFVMSRPTGGRWLNVAVLPPGGGG